MATSATTSFTRHNFVRLVTHEEVLGLAIGRVDEKVDRVRILSWFGKRACGQELDNHIGRDVLAKKKANNKGCQRHVGTAAKTAEGM